MASLSEEKGKPLSQWAFTGFSLHRNTGLIHKAHQSLSGSKDQGIDNIPRTIRALIFKIYNLYYIFSITI